MAHLWADRATVLNDERVVIRHFDGRFRVYGTPWHGDYRGISPAGVPLKRVFFLRHGDRNRAGPVEKATAAAELIARSFSPVWDRDGMSFSLEFGIQLAGKVPFHDLSFRPDPSVVEYVRCMR